MHPAWLAAWEHGFPCTDYGPPDGTDNLLERCTAAYERFDAAPLPKHAAWAALSNTGEECENCEAIVDAYASEMTGRPGDEDGEDDHLGFYGVQKSQNQLQSEILLFLSNCTIKRIFSGVSPPPPPSKLEIFQPLDQQCRLDSI